MAQNFIGCDRDQAFLMPPSLREWLPEDLLAWFVIEAVEEIDLEEFYAEYREDGHGRAANEPSMMVALCCMRMRPSRQRSSRAIERHCRQDIAYRVITTNGVPDQATIARFLARHEAALGGLFGSVPALCARAGLVSAGVVAIDGTKLSANASREANLDYERIARAPPPPASKRPLHSRRHRPGRDLRPSIATGQVMTLLVPARSPRRADLRERCQFLAPRFLTFLAHLLHSGS
jgi:transposase